MFFFSKPEIGIWFPTIEKITNKFKIERNTQTVLGFVVQGDSEPRGEKVWRFMLIQSYSSFLANHLRLVAFAIFFPDILPTIYIPGGARWRLRSLIFIMSGLLMDTASVHPRCWQLFSSNHLLKSAGLDTIRQTGLQWCFRKIMSHDDFWMYSN